MNEKGKFWMVYCEGGHNPTISHRRVMDAYSEAKRVSSKENKRVFVLEAIGGFEIPNVEPTLFEVKR